MRLMAGPLPPKRPCHHIRPPKPAITGTVPAERCRFPTAEALS